jgi:hypothetical protein
MPPEQTSPSPFELEWIDQRHIEALDVKFTENCVG